MLEDYTPYQQGIIKRYYQNQDAAARQRLGELVTDLFLAEGKKRQRLWKTVAAALKKIGLSEGQIDHLVARDDPALLAKVLKDLEK
jgi:hypothetical protein